MEASRSKKILDLFRSEVKAICEHPFVLIASRSLHGELEAIAGWGFDGRSEVPRNLAKAAANFEDALDLLKESLVLVAVDRIINRTSTSRDSRSHRKTVSRRRISGHPIRSLASRRTEA